MYESRTRQPYKRKTVSKGGALIFGMGLGALVATVVVLLVIILPNASNISSRIQYLPYYARTVYRQMIPQPTYLPTPAPTVSAAVVASQNDGVIKLDLPPVISDISSDEIIPVAASSIGSGSNNASPATDSGATAEENLLAPDIPLQPVGDQVQLVGLSHQWQTWNNCGPATITTNMSFFGRHENQAEAALFLKPNEDDKNVNPHELAAYARSVGLGAVVRQGGSIEKIKLFLSNDFPILAETWLVHDGDGLGHYRLITGFDDQTGEFITHDSLSGPDHRVSYEQFDADWRVFNRLYLVVYPQEKVNVVSSIIGEDVDITVMYQRLINEANREIKDNPNDAIAHFNLGEAQTRLGQYQKATLAFDEARKLGLHWRRLWYQFAPFESYYAAGRYQDVLDLAQATINSTGGLEEAYYFKGLALYATGQPGAENAFQDALDYNSSFSLAQRALDTLAANQ